MTTIGMNVSTWRQVMQYNETRSIENWAERLEFYIQSEHFLETNWMHFADQYLISLKIYRFLKEHGQGLKFNF